MMVSIDRAGRVVIPKEIRDRLSLGADAELEIEMDGDAIRLVPVRPRGRRSFIGRRQRLPACIAKRSCKRQSRGLRVKFLLMHNI